MHAMPLLTRLSELYSSAGLRVTAEFQSQVKIYVTAVYAILLLGAWWQPVARRRRWYADASCRRCSFAQPTTLTRPPTNARRPSPAGPLARSDGHAAVPGDRARGPRHPREAVHAAAAARAGGGPHARRHDHDQQVRGGPLQRHWPVAGRPSSATHGQPSQDRDGNRYHLPRPSRVAASSPTTTPAAPAPRSPRARGAARRPTATRRWAAPAAAAAAVAAWAPAAPPRPTKPVTRATPTRAAKRPPAASAAAAEAAARECANWRKSRARARARALAQMRMLARAGERTRNHTISTRWKA